MLNELSIALSGCVRACADDPSMTFLKSAPMSNNTVETNLTNESTAETAVVSSSDLIYSHYWDLRGWVCQKVPPKASSVALMAESN